MVTIPKPDNLKPFLDEWADRINVPAFIEKDPVSFVHRYKNHSDIEVVALLAATIAWGRRDMILRSGEKMFGIMGKSPFDYIMSEGWKNLGTKCVHRTFFEKDLLYFCRGLKECYLNYGGPEGIFSGNGDLFNGITTFREVMAGANNNTYSKHVSNPVKKSACKRLHLALRWLVRNDGIVDLGIWKNIHPSQLYIPLDVHVGRVSRLLGLLSRKSSDMAAVKELTLKLKEFCPEDPVKYDFALFGIGLNM